MHSFKIFPHSLHNWWHWGNTEVNQKLMIYIIPFSQAAILKGATDNADLIYNSIHFFISQSKTQYPCGRVSTTGNQMKIQSRDKMINCWWRQWKVFTEVIYWNSAQPWTETDMTSTGLKTNMEDLEKSFLERMSCGVQCACLLLIVVVHFNKTPKFSLQVEFKSATVIGLHFPYCLTVSHAHT